jgi:hypothetical protein
MGVDLYTHVYSWLYPWARGETHKISQPAHGSGTWIARFHAALSMASSLVILQSFISLFMDSSHVKFGLPQSLLTLLARFSHPLCTGASKRPVLNMPKPS